MAYEAETEIEKNRMLSSGMELWTDQEFRSELLRLGYGISEADSFNYLNTLNGLPYLARSVHIIDLKSRHSFANIATKNPNLVELQKIRFKAFVYKHSRIWEI